MTAYQGGFGDITDSEEIILRKGLKKIGVALSRDRIIEIEEQGIADSPCGCRTPFHYKLNQKFPLSLNADVSHWHNFW
jgi:hypothetical protein